MVSLRPENTADAPFVSQLLKETIAEELMAWAWPEAMRETLLEMQINVRLQGVDANYPDARRMIILRDDAPAGRMVVSDLESEIRVLDIAVVPQYRGSGIGASALQFLIDESKAAGKPLRLNVNVTNRACNLYRRLGFQRYGGDEVQHYLERLPD